MATYITNQGEQVESNLSDAEAVAILRQHRALDSFAMSLCIAFDSGRLTAARQAWLHKLAVDTVARLAGPPQVDPALDFESIVNFLTHSTGLKQPKLYLTTQTGEHLRISTASPRGKHAGKLAVSDGKPYPNSLFYGWITATGEWQPRARVPLWVVHTLQDLAKNPADYLSRWGKMSGTCCFCGLQLDTPESKAVGYGPVCAQHYHLPWGGKVAAPPPVVVSRNPTPTPAPVVEVQLPQQVQVYDPRNGQYLYKLSGPSGYAIWTPHREEALVLDLKEAFAQSASWPYLEGCVFLPLDAQGPVQTRAAEGYTVRGRGAGHPDQQPVPTPAPAAAKVVIYHPKTQQWWQGDRNPRGGLQLPWAKLREYALEMTPEAAEVLIRTHQPAWGPDCVIQPVLPSPAEVAAEAVAEMEALDDLPL